MVQCYSPKLAAFAKVHIIESCFFMFDNVQTASVLAASLIFLSYICYRTEDIESDGFWPH